MYWQSGSWSWVMFGLHNIWWITSGVHVTVTASGLWTWSCSQSVLLFVCVNIPWTRSPLPLPLCFLWIREWLAFMSFAPCLRVWSASILSLVCARVWWTMLWSSLPIPGTRSWAVLEMFSGGRCLALATRCIVGLCQNTVTASGFWMWSWSVISFICVNVPWIRSTVSLPFPWLWTRVWLTSMPFSPCSREWSASIPFQPCVRVWWDYAFKLYSYAWNSMVSRFFYANFLL